MQRYADIFAWCLVTCKGKPAHPRVGRGGREELRFAMGAAQGGGRASETVLKSLMICHRVAGALDWFSNNEAAAAAE